MIKLMVCLLVFGLCFVCLFVVICLVIAMLDPIYRQLRMSRIRARERKMTPLQEAVSILRRFEKSDVTAIGFDLKRIFTKKVLEEIRRTEPDYATLTLEQVIYMDKCLIGLNSAKNDLEQLRHSGSKAHFDIYARALLKHLQGTGYCLSDLGTSKEDLARLRSTCEDQIFRDKVEALQQLRGQLLELGIGMLDYLKSRNKSIYDCPPDLAAFLETCR